MVRIGNVAINVSDLERSERFYVNALGLEVLTRIDTPDVREVIVGTPGEGSQLMLAKHTTAHRGEPSGIWKVFRLHRRCGCAVCESDHRRRRSG